MSSNLHPHPHILLSTIFIKVILLEVTWSLIVALICTSSMTNDVEQLLTHSLVISYPLLTNVKSYPLNILKLRNVAVNYCCLVASVYMSLMPIPFQTQYFRYS